MAPAFAQTPDQPAKPAEQAADKTQAPTKPEEKPAEAAKTEAQAAASPAPSGEQWITGSVDFGYRWVTNGGNFPEYRSVVNLGEGPKLLGVDLTFTDPKKRLFDVLNVRGYGWGGDPYSSAHVDARKRGLYEFNFDYRNIAYFNAIPSYANPIAPAGFDQQSFDTHRRNMSFSLDLFPGKHIIPYVAYERNSGYGHGIDTWVQDAVNSYAVPTLLRDSTNVYRGGLRFEYSRFHVTLEQGYTTYKDDDQTYYTGPNNGELTTPVLGQTMTLNSLQQQYGIRGHGIWEKALLTANPAPWIDIFGQFVYSQPKTDVNYQDYTQGAFANTSMLLIYSAQQSLGTGAANQPHTTGNVGFELRPFRRLRIIESLSTDRSHDAASPYVVQSLIGKGFVSQNATYLNCSPYVNYNQQEVNVIFDVTSKMTLRGGYRYVWGDAFVLAGQLSQSGTLLSGQLKRNVGLAGFTFRPTEKFTFNADYEGGSSDDIYFRTSLNDYHKARVRARYQVLTSLSFGANFQVTSNQNPAPGINLDYLSRDNSVAVYWTPANGKWISLTGEYDRATMRDQVAYLSLPFLSSAVSSYRDNAHLATAALDVALPKYGALAPKLTLGGSLFLSGGSQPTQYFQPLARLALPLGKHVYWNTEWQYYGFGESFYGYEGFRTHIFLTGLKVTL
jgi:hypothetical protein